MTTQRWTFKWRGPSTLWIATANIRKVSADESGATLCGVVDPALPLAPLMWRRFSLIIALRSILGPLGTLPPCSPTPRLWPGPSSSSATSVPELGWKSPSRDHNRMPGSAEGLLLHEAAALGVFRTTLGEEFLKTTRPRTSSPPRPTTETTTKTQHSSEMHPRP